MLRKKITKSIALLMSATMLLASCGGKADPATSPASTAAVSEAAQGDAEQKILRLNNASEPGALHPSLAQGTHDSWPINHMFFGLYEKDTDGKPVLEMATEEPQISEDGKVWTFKLREDALWSNGEPIKASDYVYTYRYVLAPETASKYASQLYVLQGGKEYNENTDESKAEELKEAVGVKAIDDYTLELTLVNPLAYFPDLLTHYTFKPISEKVQTEDPKWYTKADGYVTSGPFVLTEWKNKESMFMTKNENFYGKDKVKLDGINWTINEDKTTEWQVYQQGELDLVHSMSPAIIEELTKANSEELEIVPDLATYYYLFNTEKAPFNNVKVRTALSQAINRAEIAEYVSKGGQTPAYGLTPLGVYTPSGKEYVEVIGNLFAEDFEGSKALLEEGLAEEGMTVDQFSFTMLYNTNDTHKAIAEAIQDMLIKNLGLGLNNIKLENAEFQVVLDRRAAGDYDMARAGWVGDYNDPMTFLELFASYHELNDCFYNNPEYDALIEKAQQEMDQEVRMNILMEAEKMMIADMPIAPIYFYTKQIAQKPYVEGVFTPNNRYPLVYYADIVK